MQRFSTHHQKHDRCKNPQFSVGALCKRARYAGRGFKPRLSEAFCVHPPKIIAIALGLFFLVGIGAAVIDVSAVVQPRDIQFSEKATLELVLSGKTFLEHIDAPIFNFLPAFLAVPLRSSTTPRLEGDKIAVSKAWYYELVPQQIGDFALSDVRFSYEGTPYFANPGTVRVSGEDTYRDTSTDGVHQVEAEVTPSNPYFNQTVTYTFRYLYTTVLPTRESPAATLPDFSDFLVAELPAPLNETKRVRGQTFQVQAEVRRLYPQKTGRIVIEPASLRLPLNRNPKTLKTEPITLTVRALPEFPVGAVGNRAPFSGAIGDYQITAQIDKTRVEVGRALALSVRISGRGNLQTLTAPQIPAIPGVTVAGPNPGEGSTQESYVYAYALVPSQAGTVRIPAITYTYFAPELGTYQTMETTPIPFTVIPKPSAVVEVEPDSGAGEQWLIWVGLLLLVIVLGAGGYLWYRHWASARAEVEEHDVLPEQAALATLTEILESRADNATAFGNAIAQVLYEYLSETLGISLAGGSASPDAVREACAKAGLSDATIQEVVDILAQCDYYRFSPAPLPGEERHALISRAEKVIQQIGNP